MGAALTAGFIALDVESKIPSLPKATPSASATFATMQPNPLPLAPPQVPPAGDELRASFDQLAATLPAEVGVAVSSGEANATFGTWQNGAAWSTIKVPLSIAALRVDTAAAEPLVSRAITQSDNSAADELWALLGAPTEAGGVVEEILAESGEPEIRIETDQVRPPYSPYGQTVWSLTQAAHFAHEMPCLDAELVLLDMQNIATDQQWGLAGSLGTPAKGGWGPEPDGRYLVRQIALLGSGPDATGVALAAKPTDGSFATGTAMLDQLATWVLEHRDELPTGDCSG